MSSDIRSEITLYGSVYGYPHVNAFLQSRLKLESCKPHKAARHPTKCDVINNVNLFPLVYHRIYCRIFLNLSNQTSRGCKSNCIRIRHNCFQNFNLGWYIVGYTVGNLVLRRRASVNPTIYLPNFNFEYWYPILMHL